MAGAVALLEQARAAGGATHVDLALLGTLYLETGRAGDALEALRPVADSEAADPAVLYNAGRAALAAGRIEAAEGYLERSVERLPLSPATRELGLLRGAQGRVTEAYRLLRGWVTQNVGDLEARLALIAAGLQIDRAAEVGPLLEGLPPGDPKIVMLRGQYQGQMGDPDGAIATLEALRANVPPEMRADFYQILADNYLAADRAGDVVALLEGKASEEPRLALLLADGRHRNGDPSAAAATLEPFARKAFGREGDVGPIAYQVILDYGRMLAAAGRAADGLPFLEKATSLRPRDHLAWQGLGEALTSLGRGDEAAAALDKSRQIAESGTNFRRLAQAVKDPATQVMLEAQQAMSKGEPQRALAILRQEIALAPRDLRPRLLETRLLVMLERPQDALKAAEKTVEVFPGHPDALHQRGVVHMLLNAPEAAVQDFRRVLELAPDHVPSLNDLAVVLMTQGKKDEAQPVLERLLEINPSNEAASNSLKRLREGG